MAIKKQNLLQSKYALFTMLKATEIIIIIIIIYLINKCREIMPSKLSKDMIITMFYDTNHSI